MSSAYKYPRLKFIVILRAFSGFFFLLIALITCKAQQASYTTFTVNDGLPSNYIYRSIEDDKGFLWVATNAGIARFDGKLFQVFTTLQGLPDNEVLAVVKEINGRIWVNCFNQSPAYFDESKNRFISAKDDSSLAIATGTGNMFIYSLPFGGVMYFNEKGSYIFRDKKLVAYKTSRHDVNFLIKENKDGSQLRWGGSIYDPILKMYQSGIFQVQGKNSLDSVYLKKMSRPEYLSPSIDDGKLYLFDGSHHKCYIYADLDIQPLRYRLDSISIPEPFFNFSFTNTSLYLVTHSGKIYVFDKRTLKQQYIISGNYLPNSFYNDSKGNIWVSTIDKGLIVYKKNLVTYMVMPAGFTRTNFLSIARKKNGTILAGNYYGELLESDTKSVIIKTISKNIPSRQRKILQVGDKVYAFSEEGIAVTSGNKPPILLNKSAYSVKTAIIYNDSTILVGYHAGLFELNCNTQKITRLTSISKRVTALTKGKNNLIYFGSTDGLYSYHYLNKTVQDVISNYPLLHERIIDLLFTPDNILWVATPGNGVIAIKDNKVLLNITAAHGIISNDCRSLMAEKPGVIWLGTEAGISIIKYNAPANKMTAFFQNLSVNDGLTNNEINEMIFQQDTVFAATGDGISIIPATISIPVFNIPVQLINVNINQIDAIISNSYSLDEDQLNVSLRFAAVELGGHFKYFQYAMNNNIGWIDLYQNTLSLQFNHGNNTLKVRAVDVNGNIGDKILTIHFNIATPFWETFLFWLFIALMVQFFTIYLLNRRRKVKKEKKLANEIAGVQLASLEQQAFTSLMNPHFMFNALNSIQHYINVNDRQSANRYLSDFASLIRKSFEAAQLSFLPLDQELENLKIYLRLEQMRFPNRFTYTIAIDEHLDIDQWMIPTMMLQPLLENALLHGIIPSRINGILKIILNEIDGNLIIIITDNGIGIQNSIASKQISSHKSHGMALIKKRIAALSHFVRLPFTIDMQTAYDDKENPGNMVTLLIPETLYMAWLKAQHK